MKSLLLSLVFVASCLIINNTFGRMSPKERQLIRKLKKQYEICLAKGGKQCNKKSKRKKKRCIKEFRKKCEGIKKKAEKIKKKRELKDAIEICEAKKRVLRGKCGKQCQYSRTHKDKSYRTRARKKCNNKCLLHFKYKSLSKSCYKLREKVRKL